MNFLFFKIINQPFQIHHKSKLSNSPKLSNSQTHNSLNLRTRTMYALPTPFNQSLSNHPLHMVDWHNPAAQFLYHQSQLMNQEDFAMIDEVYAEIDTANDGLQCEVFTEDSEFVVEQQAKHPGAIESFQDENDVELIEDGGEGHIVIQPDDDDDDDETPESWCDSSISPRYSPTSPRSPPPLHPTSPRTSPPPLHESPRTPSPPTRTKPTKQPTLKRNVKITGVVQGPMNTIRYYKAEVQNGPESGRTCYIPSHLLAKGINARVGDYVKAIVFPTEEARYDFRAIKCLPMDEMERIQFHLTLFGEQNVGLLIGRGGCNLERLSKLASPSGSTYFPRIKLTKKFDSIIEITYKKNSNINKSILIDNIMKTCTQPDWAVSPQYITDKVM